MPGASVLSLIELKKRQLRDERIKKRYLRDLLCPTDMNEKLFISLYRLNKAAFQMVLDVVAPQLQKCSISANCSRTEIFSSWILPRCYCQRLKFDHETLYLLQTLMENQQSQNASKSHFYQKFCKAGVVGCVDGTLVGLVKPSSDHAVYFSRKGHYSLNAMRVCDYELYMLAVDACRPGSCHDSFLWKMSDAKRFYSELYSEGNHNFRLLEDSGYPLKPYLLTPYKNPTYGTMQHTFNQEDASARNVVERTIGVLKSRFRCLQSVLPYITFKVVTIINVCCALHNTRICKNFGITLPEQLITTLNEDDFETAEEDEYDNTAANNRDSIVRSLHSNSTV